MSSARAYFTKWLATGVALCAILSLAVACSGGVAASQPSPAAVRDGFVPVEGALLHYIRSGSGPPLILLHGWPETSHAWMKVMPTLSTKFTVIAFDLPGLGDSSIPATGYDTATTSRRVHEGVQELGFTGPVALMAHDVGALVAYPYARDFPTGVGRMVILEAPLPGFGLEQLYGISWHLGFNMTAAPIPERIMDDEDVPTFLGWLFSSARHPERIDQAAAFRAYATGPRRTAGYNYYRALQADAANNRAAASNRLKMPVLAVGGQFAFGPAVAASYRQVADDVREGVAPDSGHWIPEENPQFLSSCALLFFGPAAVRAPAGLTQCAP